MPPLSIIEKKQFWTERSAIIDDFKKRENKTQKFYKSLPVILLVGAVIGFALALISIAHGIRSSLLIQVFSIIIVLLFLSLFWTIFNSFESTKKATDLVKSYLPLWSEDRDRIKEYFEYEKKCIPKLHRIAFLTLPFGILIVFSNPDVITLMILLLIVVAVPLLASFAYFMYVFLENKYKGAAQDKIPEIRRFIAIESFDVLCLSIFLTLILIPMHVLLDISCAYAKSIQNAGALEILRMSSDVLFIFSFICWSPAIVAAFVITLMPLPLVMVHRALKWYLSLTIVLILLLALPIPFAFKFIGILTYLSFINCVTTPTLIPVKVRLKAITLGAIGITIGLIFGVMQQLIGMQSFSLVGVTVALTSAILVDIILC